MAQVYFADTWYFIALLMPRDGHHHRARTLQTTLARAIVVTHEGVLTELLSYFAGRGVEARRLAAETARRALGDMTVVPVDHAVFMRALGRYEQRHDKEYSLVDCTSMVVMEQLGITHVLTNDHHFRQEGFTVVNQ